MEEITMYKELEKENEEEHFKCKIQGLDLILKSINCEKYKSTFDDHDIDEHTMLHLTESDLKYMNINDEDIVTILASVNVLNKTLNLSEIKLSNDEILKMQSNICGQLGLIALILNHIYNVLNKNKDNFDDILIDNYLSSIDAALMLKHYMRSEEKQIEKSLKNVLKIKKKNTILIVTTVCTVSLLGLGFTLWHFNYSFNFIATHSNVILRIKNWKM